MGRIIIIGAGAAGMMAAIAAAREGAVTGKSDVLLLEKNEKSGKKIYITGKGRCNVTNAAEPEEVLRQVIRNPKFLYSSFRAFDNGDTMAFFEEIGLPIKTERGNRVFPQSDKSSDVIRVLNKEMERLHVQVRYHAAVREVCVEERDGKPHFTGVIMEKDGAFIKGDALIIATGGLSYQSTGSTGDGYRFAEKLGHKVLPTRQSLVPFDTKEDWVRELQGLALKNISVSLWQLPEGQTDPNGKKKIYEEFGELLFTHFGVSGPVILSASSIAGDAIQERETELQIDLKPALTWEQMDQRLLRDLEEMKNKAFKNCLDQLLPRKMVPVIVFLSGIDPEKKANLVTREERRKLCGLLKGLPITVRGLRGYAEAVITKGGVSVKEVSPKTMESKKVSGVYFAGEVLDLDAMTGGYNLQIAWSTGHAAGRAAAIAATPAAAIAVQH